MVSLTNDFPYDGKTSPKLDALIKDFVLSFIGNQYFVWTCIVLILNYKKWKRPVIIILVLHWLFRSIGDVFLNHQEFIPRKYVDNWPFSNQNWFYCFGVASIFWYISEIFGDWYPLLRTTAIIRNRKKIIIVYFICGAYNILKLVQMYFYLTYIPFRDLPVPKTDSEKDEFNKMYQADLGKFKSLTWGNVAVQFVISFFYDLCIIMALRKNLFNKLRDKAGSLKENENKFLMRFKFISEYRIIISLSATIIVFPLIVGFALFMIKQYTTGGDVVADNPADAVRQCVLSINYTLMYVDQILLRFFVDENTEARKSEAKTSYGSSGYGSTSYNSNSNYSYNKYNSSKNYESQMTISNPITVSSTLDTYNSYGNKSLNETLYKEFTIDNSYSNSNLSNSDKIPIIKYSNNKGITPLSTSPGYHQSSISNVRPVASMSPVSNISPMDKYYPINEFNNFKQNNYNFNNKNYYNHNY